ncbi:glutamine--fructose-6-phosphate aminotransferase [isomerizing] [Thiosulfatimonas sediminis]|uniref:Glutamine--fructose-6-phosphate aminotransferase [isomerizing] n=1 Tax=Thiosulfatimonas sediminis TaxID=2675054 RepID=A0A6F8PSH1_9GAMM|nr:glutamine--fructose-6-phosphate transaminase (isomerizing) [Thiosulfatimonas sediminis]BBP45082.1 glutamine--fructose-6-phosphate aminotransferase [isomerizing] [Thiosulfatimonas sediminis]
MCGIVGGVAERNLTPILLEGLRRLEYRGYDSSGIALLADKQLKRVRSIGKIARLQDKIAAQQEVFSGSIGIAHTRWATHGVPAEENAHPHICNHRVAVVHNGIIENHAQLKAMQLQAGYRFTSQTDTEVIAHSIDEQLNLHNGNLLSAVQATLQTLHGAYALGVIATDQPDLLIAARCGSPLVIGVGIGEYFIASDVSALLPVTQEFIFLEEGDIAAIQREQLDIFDQAGQRVERPIVQSNLSSHSVELGEHRHYMHKEIFEQPQAVTDTLQGRTTDSAVLVSAFGHGAEAVFKQIEQVQIIACGTSYHAGLVAKYWFEDIIQMPCAVEVASEYRYRNPVIRHNTLLLTISQSGETADTLAALREAKKTQPDLSSMTICNAPESSLTRESNLVFLTHAGPEIGVASTKAFTTQLVSLALLLTAIGQVQKTLPTARETAIIKGLKKLPTLIQNALQHEPLIKEVAQLFADKNSALFLGRGTMYPIAMEGALKLKEISYIHAEAYPAGELKHGPLALIDDSIPVIAIAPKDELLEKLKSNLQEVKARGGQMIVFEDEDSDVRGDDEDLNVIKATTNVGRITAPITFNIPLQLLSYHVALIKGTDVDQPRNLAKSVTVE